MIEFNKAYSKEEFNSFCDCDKKSKSNSNRIFTELGTYKEISCFNCNYNIYIGNTDQTLKSIKLLLQDGRTVILYQDGFLLVNSKNKNYFSSKDISKFKFNIKNIHKRIENLLLLL
jgi:hypothetical protein